MTISLQFVFWCARIKMMYFSVRIKPSIPAGVPKFVYESRFVHQPPAGMGVF